MAMKNDLDYCTVVMITLVKGFTEQTTKGNQIDIK
jgi:hypothetical protein